MSEALINWFMVTLGGKVGKEFILFLISMVPILELRGGLLAAGPAFLNVELAKAVPICVIGNLVPIPFILLLITKIFDWMKGTKRLKPMVEKLEKKAMSKSDKIEKYELLLVSASQHLLCQSFHMELLAVFLDKINMQRK